jgi:aspartyl protease family protein
VTCFHCLQPICEVCSLFHEGSEWCPRCLAAWRKRKQRVRLLAWSGAALVLGATVIFVASGRAAPLLERKEVTRLREEPCDKGKALKLAEQLLHDGENREVLTRAGSFFAKCGDWPRLRWTTYEAHKRLSERGEAIADATKLIESQPDDKDYWWWRGIVYEEAGELENAAADYRQAIAVEPRLNRVPFNLATVLERLGRPCDAIFPIEQYLYYHPQSHEDPALKQRLDRLRNAPGCQGWSGSGKTVIRFRSSDPAIHVNVHVGDAKNAKFIVDTGASFVALNRSFAEKIGADRNPSTKIRIFTAAGPRTAHVTVLDSIVVQGLKAEHVEAAILEDDMPGVDGLLGLSFLSRFTMKLDHASGRLELAAK